MQPLYSIPIIPHNLRREETIVQTADALKHLNDVSIDIFNRINKRIEANTAHLTTIIKRIEATQLKVNKLQGAKKATQVFSSSKYPAGDVYRRYKSVFDKDHKVVLSHSKFKYTDMQLKDEPVEPLQFYHVKGENKDFDNSTPNGIGDVPIDASSVNDLLLCNTGKNPYANYVMSDPLQASSRLRKVEIAKASRIGAPPHSLVERATVMKSTTDSYFYSPDLGNVPAIDVPLDLPDLPGIADDLRYIDQVGAGIAPSVTTTPIVSDLPPLAPDISIVDSMPDLPAVPPASVIIPDLQEIPKERVDPDIKNAEDVEIRNSEIRLNTTSTLPVVNDARASLMDAIRKAGGSTNSNLKNLQSKKQETGDLMADLHAKLSLRRKGISGLKNPDPNATASNLDSNSPMQKISAMIPPPPVKVDQSDSTNTEDEEWDD